MQGKAISVKTSEDTSNSTGSIDDSSDDSILLSEWFSSF